jgi:RHS repeat-associated protein
VPNLPQISLDSVYVGTLPSDPIYVQDTEYDSAGRVTLRTLGSTNPVQTHYTYYPWNASVNGGKLQQIYTTRNAQVLQNFQYSSDSNSNISSILDYVMGSPQTQSFSYDNLDRLTSAGAANGTDGNYSEAYNYDAATGNLANKDSAAYDYEAQSAGCPDGALEKAHAVVAAGDNSYCYDQNGNMVQRVISDTNYITYTLTYDAENHMTGYSGGSVSASFVYDGDGQRVQATLNGVTTQFVGSHVEWQSSTTDMVRYYYAGGVRVAMRTGADGLVWLVGDHLGSTSIAVTDTSGATERQGYKAWGETRFGSLPTKYQFAGQRSEPELGLHYYGARWYDPALSRWTQFDSIIPGNQGVQAYDRYAYVNNNALKYTDPSGHEICDSDGYCGRDGEMTLSEKYRAISDGTIDLGKFLKSFPEWQLILLALAIFTDSGKGTLPISIMEMMARVFLNRVDFGLYDDLIAAVAGSNSPIQSSGLIKNSFPDLQRLDEMSPAEVQIAMESVKAGMAGIEGWGKALAAAFAAMSAFEKGEPDPTGGATNYRMQSDPVGWGSTLKTAQANSSPGSVWSSCYHYITKGPYYSKFPPGWGVNVWIIFDNRDYCYRQTGAG